MVSTLNRYHFTDKFIQEIKDDLENKIKWRPFIRKFKPIHDKRRDILIIDGKEIVPRKDVQKRLRELTTTTSVPLGINTCHSVLEEKYIGITRGMIRDFLKTDGVYQRNALRPPASKKNRNKMKREGITSIATLKRWPNTLGIDLVSVGQFWLPKSYTKTNKNIVVVLHKYSGYVWAELLGKYATAAVVLRHFKRILADAEQKFGRVKNVDHDNGTEFMEVYEEFLKDRKPKIRHNIMKKVHYVEKANSILARNISFYILSLVTYNRDIH